MVTKFICAVNYKWKSSIEFGGTTITSFDNVILNGDDAQIIEEKIAFVGKYSEKNDKVLVSSEIFLNPSIGEEYITGKYVLNDLDKDAVLEVNLSYRVWRNVDNKVNWRVKINLDKIKERLLKTNDHLTLFKKEDNLIDCLDLDEQQKQNFWDSEVGSILSNLNPVIYFYKKEENSL